MHLHGDSNFAVGHTTTPALLISSLGHRPSRGVELADIVRDFSSQSLHSPQRLTADRRALISGMRVPVVSAEIVAGRLGNVLDFLGCVTYLLVPMREVSLVSRTGSGGFNQNVWIITYPLEDIVAV